MKGKTLKETLIDHDELMEKHTTKRVSLHLTKNKIKEKDLNFYLYISYTRRNKSIKPVDNPKI